MHLKRLLISHEAMADGERIVWQGIAAINPWTFYLLGLQLDTINRKPDYIMQVCSVFTFQGRLVSIRLQVN